MTNMQKKTFLMMLSVIFVDYFSFGVVFVMAPFLVKYLHYRADIDSLLLGVFLAAYPLGQFFGAGVLGSLSDAHGRKRILLISLVGTLFGFCISGVAIDFKVYWLILLARFIAGLFAGNVAIAQAVISDISSEGEKGKNLSIVQAVIGVSWIIATPIGGFIINPKIISWFSLGTPVWLSAFLIACILIIVSLLYNPQPIQAKTSKKINFFENLDNLKQVMSDNKVSKYFLSWYFFVFGWWLFEALIPNYLHLRFHYSSEDVGILLSIMGVTYFLSQMILVNKLLGRLKLTLIIKCTLPILSVIIMSSLFATESLYYAFFVVLYVIVMSFSIPAFITEISNLKEDSQGATMGLISSVQSLGNISAMVIGGGLMSVSIFSPSILSCIFMLVSLVIFVLFGARARSFITT